MFHRVLNRSLCEDSEEFSIKDGFHITGIDVEVADLLKLDAVVFV